MNPYGGKGAIMAMHDAVTLANWINTFRLADVKKMEGVWKEYRAERRPVAMASFKSSQLFSRTSGKVSRSNSAIYLLLLVLWFFSHSLTRFRFFQKNMISIVTRALMKRIPDWLWKKM